MESRCVLLLYVFRVGKIFQVCAECSSVTVVLESGFPRAKRGQREDRFAGWRKVGKNPGPAVAQASAGEAHSAVTDFERTALGAHGYPPGCGWSHGGPGSALFFLPDSSHRDLDSDGCRCSPPMKGSHAPRGGFKCIARVHTFLKPETEPSTSPGGFWYLTDIFCRHLSNNSAINFSADMNRTFPDNVRFRKSADPCLQKTLYNVLLAYGHHNQGVGYCQVSPGR